MWHLCILENTQKNILQLADSILFYQQFSVCPRIMNWHLNFSGETFKYNSLEIRKITYNTHFKPYQLFIKQENMESASSEKYTEEHRTSSKKSMNSQNQTGKTRKPLKSYKRWTHEENIIYAMFLRNFEEDFSSEWNRRSKRVYRRLSKLIVTKSTSQCKSHHQKMLKYCGSLQKVITKYLIQRQPEFHEAGQPFPFFHPFLFPPGLVKTDDQDANYVKMEPLEHYLKYANLEQSLVTNPLVKQEEIKSQENTVKTQQF